MKTAFLVTQVLMSIHWFRSEPIDEATVRSIIVAVFLTLVYLAIRAIGRVLKL